MRPPRQPIHRILLALLLAAPSAADPDPQAGAPATAPAPSISGTSAARTAAAGRGLVAQGHRCYYQGEPTRAAASYRRALKKNPKDLEAWLNGGVVLEELGDRAKAVAWFAKAAALAPADAKALTALGWAEFRNKDVKAAEAHFKAALSIQPRELYARLGLGRVKLSTNRAAEAVADFNRSSELEPLNNLAHFWTARAMEAMGNPSGAVAAYKKAALGDSYFVEARYALGRAYMRRNRFYDAAAQFAKVLEADPENRTLRRLREKTQRLLPDSLPPEEKERLPPGPKASEAALSAPRRPGRIPMLRVGIGTSALGKPLPRKGIRFQCTTPFDVLDGKTGRALAAGQPDRRWRATFASRKKRWAIDLADPAGKRVASVHGVLLIRPRIDRGGLIALYDDPSGRDRSNASAVRILRGDVEVSVHPDHRALKLVNVVDLESYTHGVLSAEMPINSPVEALKAQAVIARSHALYIKAVTRRHAKDGYDVCDGQHCQVYMGAGSESERSRDVVEATRGRIVAYKGRVAHVLYSSDCGGHTQSGGEVAGWGEVPYWVGTVDAPPGAPAYPQSPWELRWWLRATTPAYCMPSEYVYPSHYRWTRLVGAKDLADKLNRRYRVGRILAIRTLRRSKSGHLNSVLVHGSRKDLRITHEINLRNLLGIGSQRSALFTLETEYGPDGKPETFVFHGGGWGHGVGLCQSGAMGRAQQGQSYDDILRAYYQGTELGNLRY